MTVNFKEGDDEWSGWIMVNRVHYFTQNPDTKWTAYKEKGYPTLATEIPYNDDPYGTHYLNYLIVKCSVCSFTMEEKINAEDMNIPVENARDYDRYYRSLRIREEDIVNCYRSLRKDCPACATKFNSWKAWE